MEVSRRILSVNIWTSGTNWTPLNIFHANSNGIGFLAMYLWQRPSRKRTRVFKMNKVVYCCLKQHTTFTISQFEADNVYFITKTFFHYTEALYPYSVINRQWKHLKDYILGKIERKQGFIQSFLVRFRFLRIWLPRRLIMLIR